jgi:hypothetical protein
MAGNRWDNIGNFAKSSAKKANPFGYFKGALKTGGNFIAGSARRVGNGFSWAAGNKYVQAGFALAAVTAVIGAVRYALRGKKTRKEAEQVSQQTEEFKLEQEILEMEAMQEYLQNYGKNLAQQQQQRMQGQTGGRMMTEEEYARLQQESGYGPHENKAPNYWRNNQRPQGKAQNQQQMLEMQLQENGAYGYRGK